MNDANLLGLLNIKQLKRKYTVIEGKINIFGLDSHNLESENHIISKIKKNKKIRSLFPIY